MNACRRLTRVVLLGVFLAFLLGAVPAHAATVLADSYPEGNFTASWPVYGPNYSQVGQSFTATAGALDSAVFYLRREAGSVGNAYALLYAHSGTFGVDGLPSGAPLATSSPVDVTTLSDSVRQLVTFPFDNTLTLTAGDQVRDRHQVRGYSGRIPSPATSTMTARPMTATLWPGSPTTGFPRAGDAVFYVYQTPTTYSPVYRFFNKKNGSHFYTASEAEKANVIAKYPTIYSLDGQAYRVSSAFNHDALPLLQQEERHPLLHRV